MTPNQYINYVIDTSLTTTMHYKHGKRKVKHIIRPDWLQKNMEHFDWLPNIFELTCELKSAETRKGEYNATA